MGSHYQGFMAAAIRDLGALRSMLSGHPLPCRMPRPIPAPFFANTRGGPRPKHAGEGQGSGLSGAMAASGGPPFKRGAHSAALCLALGLAACASPQPPPPATLSLWRDLLAEQAEAPSPFESAAASAEPQDPVLWALALEPRQPSLQLQAAEIQAARAYREAAGRWGDVEFSFDGMNALAPRWILGSAGSVDYWAGTALAFRPPRPGELKAKKAAAAALVAQLEFQQVGLRSQLALEICLAAERLAALEAEAKAQARWLEAAELARTWFQRARAQGSATALEAGLAEGEWAAARSANLALSAQRSEALRELNRLLLRNPDAACSVQLLSLEQLETRLSERLARAAPAASTAAAPSPSYNAPELADGGDVANSDSVPSTSGFTSTSGANSSIGVASVTSTGSGTSSHGFAAAIPADGGAAVTELEALLLRQPEVAAARAAWQMAIANLELELARRFPELTLGTLLAITPAILSGWNAPAVAAARARLAAAETNAAASLRQAQHDWAHCQAQLQAARDRRAFVQASRLPAAAQARELVQAALAAGQLTLPEALMAQRAAYEAEHEAAQAEQAQREALWRALHSAALLLPEEPPPSSAAARQ